MRRGPRDFAVTSLLVISVLAACVRQPQPRVGVKNIAAELVFGVPPQEGPAAPPGVIPDEPESTEPTDVSFRGRSSPSAKTAETCREAGPNDFPAQAAPTDIQNKPKEGIYSWKMTGKQKVPGLPFPITIDRFTDRKVVEIVEDPVTPENFTFKTVEPDPNFGSRKVITQTFKVDKTNASARLRGVLLTEVLEESPDGATSRFSPNPPIQYLPTPVQQGTEARFETVGVDPSSLRTLQHTGFVKERMRIDVCGTVIDSWLVDGEQLFASGGTTTRRNYDYAIVTHFGGLIGFEHSESPCAQTNAQGRCNPEGDLIFDAKLAQTEPDPVGEGR